MSKFVEFVNEMNTTAAQYVHEMEQIIYKDPGSAIVKGRKFLEVILNDITLYEELDQAYLTYSLYEKIAYLVKDRIIDGRKIQKSFDTVRIIGNRGAHHSETNEYEDAFKVHRDLYEIAIWFHDLYFFTENNSLVPVYESPRPESESKLNYEEEIKRTIERLVKGKLQATGSGDDLNTESKNTANKDEKKVNAVVEQSTEIKDTRDSNKEKEVSQTVFEKNLGKGQSYLERELNRLKSSSKEAIENADQFSVFKDYLHVERPILTDLEKLLEESKNNENGNLILLCGNVGDGKSHILAYLNKNKPELLEGFEVFNDATESFSPGKDSLATLEESLSGFSDQKIHANKTNIILAINMGVLHNFISRNHEKYTYDRLINFVDKSELFSSEIKPKFVRGHFSLLSFGDYNPYELTDKGAISTFYSALLRKIVETSEKNPFYLALREDKKNHVHTVIHDNYKLLRNESVQEHIIQLIIQSIITDKLVISARAFLNFIADILIPSSSNSKLSDLETLDQTLPNLLFSHHDRSDILKSISKLDPLHRRSEKTDQLVISLNTLEEWESVVKDNVKEEVAIRWLKPFFYQEALTGYSFDTFFETFVRVLYLLEREFADSLTDESYTEYVNYLYHFDKGNREAIINFHTEFKNTLFAWKGSPKKDFIYINKPSERYRIAQKIDLRPTIDHIKIKQDEVLQTFQTTITLMFADPIKKKEVKIDIDYPLYKLLSKVKSGYRPNKRDEENAIQFTEFVDKTLKFGDKKDELLIYFKMDDYLFSLKKGDFGSYVFEKESE